MSWFDRVAGALTGAEPDRDVPEAPHDEADAERELDPSWQPVKSELRDLRDNLNSFVRAGTSWLGGSGSLFGDKAQQELQTPLSRRIRVVGVMGSGQYAHERLARPLGAWIAHAGYHLLTGGGPASMEATALAFTQIRPRRGMSIGVIPASSAEDPSPHAGCPNDFVELPIFTHLHMLGTDDVLSRNRINVLSSDVIVALPGGAGTRSEIALALQYKKPVCIFQAKGDLGTLSMQFDTVPAYTTLDEVSAFVRENIAILERIEQQETAKRILEKREALGDAVEPTAAAVAAAAGASGEEEPQPAPSPVKEQPHASAAAAARSVPGADASQVAHKAAAAAAAPAQPVKEQPHASAAAAAAEAPGAPPAARDADAATPETQEAAAATAAPTAAEAPGDAGHDATEEGAGQETAEAAAGEEAEKKTKKKKKNRRKSRGSTGDEA